MFVRLGCAFVLCISLCNIRCSVLIVLPSVSSVLCNCSVQFAVYDVQFSGCIEQCSVQYAVYNEHLSVRLIKYLCCCKKESDC